MIVCEVNNFSNYIDVLQLEFIVKNIIHENRVEHKRSLNHYSFMVRHIRGRIFLKFWNIFQNEDLIY